jgi:hypothetical protein
MSTSRERMQANADAAKKKAEKSAGANSFKKIPKKYELFRELPNSLIRSSLFSATGNGDHQKLDRVVINTPKGTTIFYSGAQLNQGDLGLWATVMNLAISNDIMVPLRTSHYQLLEAMGLKGGGASEKTLKSSLARLNSGTVEVNCKNQLNYSGKLIDKVEYNSSGRGMAISLNPSLKNLLGGNDVTIADWIIFKYLQKKPLAQWLHLYYSTHTVPYAIKIDTIRQWCGSKSNHANKFSQQLRKALETLTNVYPSNGGNFTYTIKGDLISVTKTNKKSLHPQANKKNYRKSEYPIP